MARYGVIVCPSCKWARAVDLRKRTGTCHRCGAGGKLSEMKIYARGDDPGGFSVLIGELNEKNTGRGLKARRGALRPKERRSEGSGFGDIFERVVERLTSGKNGMTVDRLKKELRKKGRPVHTVEKRVAAMLESGELYEPEEGVYRKA